jgi:hypothetical protein
MRTLERGRAIPACGASSKVFAIARVSTVALAPTLALAAALGLPGRACAQFAGGTLGDEPPPGDRAGEGDAAVMFEGPARVLSGDVVESLVVLEGPTRVDGVVVRDVVAIAGDVSVSGTVGGDVIALGGVVRLEPSAQVGGDLVSPRPPVIAPGAQLRGVVHTGASRLAGTAPSGARYVLAWLAMSVSAVLFALLLGVLVPEGGQRAVLSRARHEPGKALGLGLVVALIAPAVALTAALTLIGIPLAIALALAAGLLAFAGFATSGFVLGRFLAWRSERRPLPPLAWVAIGTALLSGLTLVPVVGTLVWAVASMFGVGSIALASYESRRAGRGRAAPPAGAATRAAPWTPATSTPAPAPFGAPSELPVGSP